MYNNVIENWASYGTAVSTTAKVRYISHRVFIMRHHASTSKNADVCKVFKSFWLKFHNGGLWENVFGSIHIKSIHLFLYLEAYTSNQYICFCIWKHTHQINTFVFVFGSIHIKSIHCFQNNSTHLYQSHPWKNYHYSSLLDIYLWLGLISLEIFIYPNLTLFSLIKFAHMCRSFELYLQMKNIVPN